MKKLLIIAALIAASCAKTEPIVQNENHSGNTIENLTDSVFEWDSK